MKSKILDRPMFKKPIDDTDVENVGIMQGFMDEDDDLDYAEYMQEDVPDEDSDMASIMDRRPDSPEILMNNLRGDMRSIDARVEELADLVGYNAASETPEGVLALLQPVLAAQQAPQMPPEMPQGMPQGMPQEAMMPQGMPQEAMMPQGIPQEAMMPQGMPQEMPPEMMGGIGALPTDQGPEMGAPVMMAKGGPVQYFRDGSDEDGVTPEDMFPFMDDDTSSLGGRFPPEIVEAARARQLARSQQGSGVPDLATEVERRIPMYEDLMGVDKNLSQAQILFELGQRAFNYGANVDDQGKPLRGSAAARLAGAVRTLPGSIGQITGQMDQQRRGVRGAALQASERNIENMMQNQARMDAAQASADARILAAEARASGKGVSFFGSGKEGNAWTTVTQLAPEYAAGTLPPELDRKFESSFAIISTPMPYNDPYTGRTVLREPVIPDYIKSSVKEREKLARSSSTVSPSGIPDLNWDAVGGRPKPGEVAGVGGTPREKTPKKGEIPGRTIWGSTDLIAGPVPSIASGVGRIIPGVAPEMQQARSFVTTAVNDLVANLRTNDRFNETERKEIKNEIDIGPRFFDNPDSLRNRIIGIDEFLRKKLTDAQTQMRDESLPVQISQDAADRATDIQKFLSTLGVPVRVYSLEDVKALPKGTPFLWNGTEPRTRQ
jgi:hypothetical protein